MHPASKAPPSVPLVNQASIQETINRYLLRLWAAVHLASIDQFNPALADLMILLVAASDRLAQAKPTLLFARKKQRAFYALLQTTRSAGSTSEGFYPLDEDQKQIVAATAQMIQRYWDSLPPLAIMQALVDEFTYQEERLAKRLQFETLRPRTIKQRQSFGHFGRSATHA